MSAQSTNARVKYHENNGVGARQQRLLHENAQDDILMQESASTVSLRLVLLIALLLISDCRFDGAAWSLIGCAIAV